MQQTNIYTNDWLTKTITEDNQYIIITYYRLESFTKYYKVTTDDYFVADKYITIANKLNNEIITLYEKVHIIDETKYEVLVDKYIEQKLLRINGKPPLATKFKYTDDLVNTILS